MLNRDMKDVRDLISRRLERTIHERKLTQNEVAKRAKISSGTLNRVLKGDDFKISTLLALSETLCIKPESLFSETYDIDSHSAAKGDIASATVHDNRGLGNNESLRHEIKKQRELIDALRSNIEVLRALVNEKERIIALLNPNFLSPDLSVRKSIKTED